ncbi:MAG: MoaD/ThiS family protein [Candidatus Kapaibacterium sp.]
MKINMKYYGIVAEKMRKQAESIDISANTVEDLINHFSEIKTTDYKVAVNQDIVKADYRLKENDEVVFLPPFAGG